MSVGGIAAVSVACIVALHGCGEQQDSSDEGSLTSMTVTTTMTTTRSTPTTLPSAACAPALANSSGKLVDSAKMADQLNEQFSGKGVLTRNVNYCKQSGCEIWKLSHTNSFYLLHEYSWSKKKNRYVVYSGGLEYGWPGFIGAPNVLESMVTCSWPNDADTNHRNLEPIGSTPTKCGCHIPRGGCSQPDGADWCDVQPHTYMCTYKADATAAMLEQFNKDGGGDSQANGNPDFYGYNEVLVDPEQWDEALPHSVQAFVIPRDCTEGSNCYSAFLSWYPDWVDKFGPWPIVHFDAEKKDAPYSALPQPGSNLLSGICGDEECLPSTPDKVDGCQSLKDLKLATPDECCNTCTTTDGCEGFEHSFSEGMCYLKTGCKTTAVV